MSSTKIECPWCKKESEVVLPDKVGWYPIGMPCSEIRLECGHGPFSHFTGSNEEAIASLKSLEKKMTKGMS